MQHARFKPLEAGEPMGTWSMIKVSPWIGGFFPMFLAETDWISLKIDDQTLGLFREHDPFEPTRMGVSPPFSVNMCKHK